MGDKEGELSEGMAEKPPQSVLKFPCNPLKFHQFHPCKLKL